MDGHSFLIFKNYAGVILFRKRNGGKFDFIRSRTPHVFYRQHPNKHVEKNVSASYPLQHHILQVEGTTIKRDPNLNGRKFQKDPDELHIRLWNDRPAQNLFLGNDDRILPHS